MAFCETGGFSALSSAAKAFTPLPKKVPPKVAAPAIMHFVRKERR
jgi:hypothetical protein